MGERVPAWIEFAPWDEDQLRASEPGRALFDAIENYGFSEREVTEQAGVAVLTCQDFDANYGTDALVGADLATLAVRAGLWCASGDDGAPEWDRHHEVTAPYGAVGAWCGSETNKTVLGESDFRRLVAERTPEDALDAIRRYFAEGNRLLGGWVAGTTSAYAAARA